MDMLKRESGTMAGSLGLALLLGACGLTNGGADGGATGGTGGTGTGGTAADAAAGGSAVHDTGVAADVGHDAVVPVVDAVAPIADAAPPPADGPVTVPDVAQPDLGPTACGNTADCADGQVCSKAVGDCDPTARSGQCVQRPSVCNDVSDPVCGCDGQTYPNPCTALTASVTVASAGACVPPPQACATDADCSAAQRCVPCDGPNCGGLCQDHGCETQPQAACDAVRTDCGADQVAVVRDGCWVCVSIATCNPPDGPQCAAAGGYCEDWQVACRDGFTGQPPMDCPRGRSAQCCTPNPDGCLPEGGMGAVVPNAPRCCPGLTSVGNTVVNAGACQMLVGGFTCIRMGDGVCGAPENICNSPDDCGMPAQCRAPADCLGQMWNIRCLGHWTCDAASQCVEACGETCGDGRCNPADGEDASNCSTDCVN